MLRSTLGLILRLARRCALLLSLVLLLAVAALVVRSRAARESLQLTFRPQDGHQMYSGVLATDRVGLTLSYNAVSLGPASLVRLPREFGGQYDRHPAGTWPPSVPPAVDVLGLRVQRVPPDASFPDGIFMIRLPWWLLVALFAAAPVRWVLLAPRRRAARRRAAGQCERCGYDVRANADRCPECGAALPPRLARVVARLRAWAGRIAAKPWRSAVQAAPARVAVRS
jgi:hypothetical protein